MRRTFAFGLAVFALETAAMALTVKPSPKVLLQDNAQANHRRAVLVELFTSEGCSSCPPADALLRAIDGKHTDPDTLIVGLSEHVTYWDHGGWKDPYGSETMTTRQIAYAKRFRLDSVYTPQMVVNGETEFVGNNSRALAQAVQKTEGELGGTVRIVSATLDGDAVHAVIAFAGDVPERGADVFAAVAQDETTAHVLGGENQGKTLVHAAVARALMKVATLHAAGETPVEMILPPGLAGAIGARRHLVVWVQEPNVGHLLGADTKAF